MRSNLLWFTTLFLLAANDLFAATIDSAALKLTLNERGGALQALLYASGETATFNEGVPLIAVVSTDAEGKEQTLALNVVSQPDAATLLAQSADGTHQATFALSSSARHLALRLTSHRGMQPGKDTLRVALFGGAKSCRWRAIELDWLPETRDFTTGFICAWKYLDQTVAPGNFGGMAILPATSDADEDASLLHLWVDEKLAHPRVEGEWTVESARTWMQDWQRTFAERSQIILEGTSLDELRAGLTYAGRMKANEVYLFTQTWRTDGFWPSRHSHVDVRRDLFPRGEDDLRAFSDEVAARGMRLNLHYVSGGIGKTDERYVGVKPDRRLASWMSGRLASSVKADARTLVVKPTVPIEWSGSEKSGEMRPHGLPSLFSYNVVRLENELIEVGSFTTAPDGALQLNQCRRGAFGTAQADHAVNSDAAGQVVAYNVNFVPDNNSTLLEEMAREFAGFIERCRISHVEYDGSEIHAYNGAWGYRKYATIVYQNLSRPVSAHDSAGSFPCSHFEYRFQSTRRMMRGSCAFTHGGWNAPVQLDSPSRAATRLLDAHFFLSQGHYGGAQGLCRPEPLFAMSESALKQFGLTDAMIQAVLDWKEVSRRLTDAQHATLEQSFSPTASTMPDRSRHRVSPLVHTVRKSGDTYELVPVRVLTRAEGDIPWQLGQEHGPIGPRQFVKLNERVDLSNLEAPQVPGFIVRVLPGFMPDARAEPKALAKVGDPAAASLTTTDLFTAGNNQAAGSAREVKSNLALMPTTQTLQARGSSTLTKFDGELEVRASNPTDASFWQCSELPGWRVPINMQERRGIGLEIEGDGSGATLLVQVLGHGSRDYAVTVDFKGKRWIEIPSGEVAWSNAHWGWRMQTKHCDYSKLSEVRLGFGFLPPRCEARVSVSSLQALAEIPVTLTDPVVVLGERQFSMKGEISTGEYLQYQGGKLATVYDANWNRLRELPVEGGGEIPTGPLSTRVDGRSNGAQPWLEIQVMTLGSPLKVGSP